MRTLQCTVPAAFDGRPLTHLLRGELGISSQLLKTLKWREGAILLNGASVHVNAVVRTGDTVTVVLSERAPRETDVAPLDIPLAIVYEDEDLLVLNKPAGLAMHPMSTDLAAPNLAELLDLVALGTVADVVPLDANNRILTWQGLSRIRAGKCRPGIKALLEIANRDPQKLAASDLGFALGPRLNAAGRLDDMSVGVALLLCDNIGEARVLANELDALNQTRKEIEQGMQAEALTLCQQLERSSDTLPGGLAMYHPQWHQGVVGILASRIKERFHRPVIAFAPTGDGTLKGSGRSIQGLHMRDALERLDTLYPGLILKFGGHAMAAGLSLEEARFEEFQQRFGELVTEWLDPALLQGEVVSDGPLTAAEMSMEVAQMLRDAGPWGQMFPEPLFDGRFRLLQQRLVGERHLKVMVEPVGGGPLLDGIAFNVDTALWPDNGVREVQLAYKLDINEFRGNRSLQIIIDNIWPI